MRKINNINEESSKKKCFNNNSTLNIIKNSILDYSYINIDSSNIFRKISLKENQLINKRMESFTKKNISNNGYSKKELVKEIIKKFIEKIYQKSDINIQKISSLISLQIKSKRKLNKDTIEEHINFFYNQRRELTNSTLVLNKNLYIHIGIVLCYVYSKFKDFSIDFNNIKEYVQKVILNKINVLTDYFLYCNTFHDDPMLLKKTYVWKKLIKKNKYEVPPELIFLINIFKNVLKLYIDLGSESEVLNQDELSLYTITLFNLEYIFPNLEHISFNFINDKLQKLIFQRNYVKIYNICNHKSENIKKNYEKDNISIYEIKWNFEQDFNLVYFNNIKLIEKKKNNKISIDDYCIVINNEEKEKEQLLKINSSIANSIISLDNLFFGNNKVDIPDFIDFESEEKDLISNKTASSSSDLNKNRITDNIKKEKKNNKIMEYMEYIDILNKYSIFFEQIIISILGVSSTKIVRKLNILSNDYYIQDINSYMKACNDIDISSIDKEFHILDIIYNNENGIDLLNLEINSLDIITFNKIIELIYNNFNLISINLSFFSADVSYFVPNLFKIYYEQIKTPKDIIDYVLKKGKNFIYDDYVNKILNEISLYFINNLSTLFEIIKKKSDLKELGFNFDLPYILVNNNNYKIPIFKFILNIIILINKNEKENISKLKKLTLLAPKIVFAQKNGINIDNFFKKISLYSTAKTLINLNIEFKFHKINYIKNIISTNLFQLSIGDLDEYSFEKLVNYLISYYFSNNSNLSNLNIKLSSMLTNFNTKLKLILQKLFNINLKNLLEIRLYTNLIIDKKANYLFLIKILQNNWIPSYIITLNEKSKKIINFFHIYGRKKIEYLVSESIQNIIYKDSGLNIIRRNSFHSSEIYWILKDLFLYKHKADLQFLGLFEIQKLIFTVLKYLFFTSEVKLEHKYNSENNEI